MNSGLGPGLGLWLGGGGLFTPLSRAPALWVKNSVGITQGGGIATAWADQSGNGFNMSGSAAYTASDAKFNNTPSIALANGIQNASVAVTQPFTVYIVAYQTVSAGSDVFNGVGSRNSIGTRSPSWYWYAGGTIITGGTADANAHAMAAIFTGGASSALYVDSSASAVASGNIGSANLSGAAVGGAFTGTGACAEIVIVSGADSTAQISQMFRYFTGRAIGVTAS